MFDVPPGAVIYPLEFRDADAPDESPTGLMLWFWCPGCEANHAFYIRHAPGHAGPVWTWNGDTILPTCRPSLLNYANAMSPRCHLWLTDGVLHFLNDCGHAFGGRSVALADLPSPFGDTR